MLIWPYHNRERVIMIKIIDERRQIKDTCVVHRQRLFTTVSTG